MRGVRLCTNRSPVFVEHNGIFPPQFACDETQSVNYLRGVLSYGLIFIFGSYWADQTYESYETRLPLWDSGGKIAMEHARTQCGFPLDPLPKFFFLAVTMFRYESKHKSLTFAFRCHSFRCAYRACTPAWCMFRMSLSSSPPWCWLCDSSSGSA